MIPELGHFSLVLALAVALVILGGLLISSLAARQRVRRELAARGLERKR